MTKFLNALKKFSKSANKKEANAANMLGQMLRPGQTKLKCSARILEAQPVMGQATGKPSADFRVVLITEGMGNSVDKHYYGPEAIDSSPRVFEGRPCYLDHPSEFEEKDIPERRVASKCGYFKNVHVETIEGERSAVADLVLDNSNAGIEARTKLQAALRYQQDFPNLDSQYVGLSINANGSWEKKTLAIDGKQVEVKYVTAFTRAISTDIVTEPARGGRVLAALVESAAGAKRKQEGVKMEKLKKLFEAARAYLKEAVVATDPVEVKTKLTEADKSLDEAIQEAAKCAEDDDMEAKKKAEAEKKGKAEEAAKKEKKGEDPDGGVDEDDDEDAVEANRIAILSLLKEAKLDKNDEVVASVSKLPLKEAQKQIEFLKKFRESTVRTAAKTMGISASNFAKLSESERTEVSKANNSKFAGCNR